MKYLEHRRHSIRRSEQDNQSFLSQAGVDLARKVGDNMRADGKSFAMVVTSILPRAIQTPMVMGYAVDETDARFSSFGDGVMDELKEKGLSWTSGYPELRGAIQPGGHFDSYCNQQLEVYKDYLSRINDDQSVLIVSHGGVIDFPLLAMFPDADHVSWGDNLSYCEGYKVSYDGSQFGDLEFLRN